MKFRFGIGLIVEGRNLGRPRGRRGSIGLLCQGRGPQLSSP